MTTTSLEGRIAGAEAVARDVVLSSGGEELSRRQQRGSFWLDTASGRIWVEATPATAVRGARSKTKRGSWSRISALPEARNFDPVAVGPHVKVELTISTIEAGTRVTITGALGRRASLSQSDGYRSGASEPVFEAALIEARPPTRTRSTRSERAERPLGQPGWAAPAALFVVAALLVAFMVKRLPVDSAFEIWAWSGWWALLVVAGSIIAARRYGHPHLFVAKPFWDFVPQFAAVSPNAVHNSVTSRTPWLFGLAFAVNLWSTPVYLIIGADQGFEPGDQGLFWLCLLSGLGNHAVAWIWLSLRFARTRADARRLRALVDGSRSHWTVRELTVAAPVERYVHLEVRIHGTGRGAYTEYLMHQSWTTTQVDFMHTEGDLLHVPLSGALIAGSAELTERRKAEVRRERWRYGSAPRWLVGHTGTAFPSRAVSGPESFLAFAADAPLIEARRALSRRRLSILALAATGVIGALATAIHDLYRPFTF